MISCAADMFLQAPDTRVLDGVMRETYALFRDRYSGVFVLCRGVNAGERPNFAAEYVGSVRGEAPPLPLAPDHPDRRRRLVPVDPAQHAVSLSRALGQTVVSFYSTDDEYDAAAVAEAGRLAHLFWQSDFEAAGTSPEDEDAPLPILHHDAARGTTEPVVYTENDPCHMFAAAERAIRVGLSRELDIYSMSDSPPTDARILADAKRTGMDPESIRRAYGDFELVHERAPAGPGVANRTSSVAAAGLSVLTAPLAWIWKGERSLLSKGVLTFLLLFTVSLALHLIVAGLATLIGVPVPEWARS